MRKTKLIILPTKCLNQMGFLLLFLSCPVIGDWGRIRPESEMSQWSIQIEREGSCGLVRDSSGIKNDIKPDGLMECDVADAALQNNTQSLIKLSQEFHTDSVSQIQIPVRETSFERRIIRSSRVEVSAERRVNNARRESQERSFRRSVQMRNIRGERRAVSLDRQTASFRNDDRQSERMQREVRYEIRDSRERRMSRSLDRRMDARRTSENSRNIQSTRLSQSRNDRRAEERRLTRRMLQDERSNARRDSERRTNIRREVRQEIEKRNSPDFSRMERRERREEERLIERRTFKERMNREVSERRNDQRMENIRNSNSREQDIRMDRKNIAIDRRIRDTTEISRRRDDSERNERNSRFAIRNEHRTIPDSRRIETDLSRKQEMRVNIRRMDKPTDRRDFISVGIREIREKSVRTDSRIRYEKQEPLTMKSNRWEFLDGLKNWFGKNNMEENSVSNHGDFATTCLVGAAVYFLTTRQVKTV